ncbi:hypothetical protein QL285_033201 [Trifolium repens]|nr:hypothetical protein QL285_033201 [Trifolium repens]
MPLQQIHPFVFPHPRVVQERPRNRKMQQTLDIVQCDGHFTNWKVESVCLWMPSFGWISLDLVKTLIAVVNHTWKNLPFHYRFFLETALVMADGVLF